MIRSWLASAADSSPTSAGPDGGTPEKPVGTVCFGLSARGALTTLTRHYPARGREFVREWAAQEALVLLYRAACELTRA